MALLLDTCYSRLGPLTRINDIKKNAVNTFVDLVKRKRCPFCCSAHDLGWDPAVCALGTVANLEYQINVGAFL